MTHQSVVIDTSGPDAAHFRAISGKRQSTGRTPGEALDALLAQEDGNIESSAILIQRFAPDAYFTQAQHDRMQELLARRTALTEEENAELDALIDAELAATVARTDSLVQHKKP
jgi:glycine cleavage system aminomethyltransferase T